MAVLLAKLPSLVKADFIRTATGMAGAVIAELEGGICARNWLKTRFTMEALFGNTVGGPDTPKYPSSSISDTTVVSIVRE